MSEMSLVQGLREEIELLNRKVAIRDAEIKLLELWLADWKERARAAERPLRNLILIGVLIAVLRYGFAMRDRKHLAEEMINTITK